MRWLAVLSLALAGCGVDEPLDTSEMQADGGPPLLAPHDAGAGNKPAPDSPEVAAPPTALEVDPGYYLALESGFVPLAEGGDLELVQAPQGGHVAFVGARIRHAKSPTATFIVSVLDPSTGEVVMHDKREGPIAPTPDLPGWSEADPDARGAINHLVACPVEHTQLFGEHWLLRVEVIEEGGGGLTGQATVGVNVSCAPISEYQKTYCECECELGYVPGTCDLPF
jgi:hypothetical protein